MLYAFWITEQLAVCAPLGVFPHTRKIIVLSTKSNCVSSFSIACSTIAKQFLLSAAKDQKALTSSKLQFIDATVKSELFVHKGDYLKRDSGSSTYRSHLVSKMPGGPTYAVANPVAYSDSLNGFSVFSTSTETSRQYACVVREKKTVYYV